MTELFAKIAPEALAEIVRETGFRANAEHPADGDPCVAFGSNGYECYAYFYSPLADAPGQYERVLLSFGIKMEKGVSFEVANEWNRTKVFGRAFISKTGGIRLEHIFLLRGGVSRASIAAYFKSWDSVLGSFLHFLDGATHDTAGAETRSAGGTDVVYDRSKLN
ncbi:MAG: YbjN domain-containing protein [Alphaproteobacteria bacterium]|nr:YbjN domain-containing protein [Alphaproteobacteria bacterium]